MRSLSLPGRRPLLLSSLAASILLVVITPVLAQSSSTSTPAAVNLQLAAQPMDVALTRLADQAGIRILFASDDVGGMQAAALSGRYSVDQALATVLARTGLTGEVGLASRA